MGNCAGGDAGSRGNKGLNDNVEAQLLADSERERKVVKILLLGTGNSGKSTILKQFMLMHTEQGLGDMASHKHSISQNVMRGVVVVAQGSHDLEEIKVSLAPRCQKIADLLKDISNTHDIWAEVELDGKKANVAALCRELWEDPAMSEVMKHEGKLSMLEVPIDYFMGNIARIMAHDYLPTEDDILQARARTSGVVKIEFTLDNIRCRMLDVGGQRNERKKWISHFDDVTAIMFLVSLSEYDKFLLEDPTKNRMHDAIEVFRAIVASPYFEDTNIILFLNKKDLFEEKIKRVDLRVCFEDYTGEPDYGKAISFVEAKYVSIFKEIKGLQAVDSVGSDIYPFATMATNTQNVRTVFNMCKHIIFKSNLASTGML